MPITINKTDIFFMAACMQDLHSFMCVGIQYEDQNQVLIEVGKAMPFNERNRFRCCVNESVILFEMLFNSLHADFLNEHKLIQGKMDGIDRATSYIAYEISYDNYLQLLRSLKQINPHLYAYVPTQDADSIVTLEYQELMAFDVESEEASSIVEHLTKTGQTLSFKSNCRDAVIDLTRLSLPLQSDLSLPKHFYQSFACINTICNSQFVEPLYILPLPPTAYDLDIAKQAIMTKLYQQLKKILVIGTKKSVMHETFESLKELYTNEAGKPDQSIQALIHAIKSWRDNHTLLPPESRSSCLFFRKKPLDLVAKIEAKYGIASIKKLFNKI
jgi:hypothetical protein